MRYATARQMVFDAYRTSRDSIMSAAIERARMGAEIQETARDQSWRIVHGLEAGAVISAVESLPPHLAALARYCFGPFTRQELNGDRETVELALYRKLMSDGVRFPGQGKGRPTAKHLETLRHLCAAALYHHSETTWPYRRAGLPTPRSIRAWLKEEKGESLDVRFWTRDDRVTWRAVWVVALFELDQWESHALFPISRLALKAA